MAQMMFDAAENQEEADRLIEVALAAAAEGKLARQHLVAVNAAVKAAVAAGATERWLAEAHRRMAAILDIRRRPAATDADPSGRRRSSRIAEPPLDIIFDDGHRSRTADWSAYGVLVSDSPGSLAAGDPVSVEVSCGLAEGGGAVSGRVVWRAQSGAVAIEFNAPSVAVQIIKVRLMRAGLLSKPSFGNKQE